MIIHSSTVCLLFLSSAFVVWAEPSSIFTATSPKLVKENKPYVTHVVLESNAAKAQIFKVSINATETDTSPAVLYTSEPVTVQPGSTQNISFDVKNLPGNYFNLTLVTYPVGSSEADGIIHSASLEKDTKDHSVLIQTDKVIYKPGEKVNFRVIVICNKLRPLDSENINITIQDAGRNVIKSLLNQPVPKGIHSNQFELSKEPVLGDWKIIVSTRGQIYNHVFTVDQYVLPKFKVEIKAPNFVTYNSSKFTAEIIGAYTYGKPIEGNVEVRLSEYFRYHYHWNTPPKIVLKKATISGSRIVEFDLGTELDVKPLTYEKQFQIQASVTDTLTGKQQNATKLIRVTQYPYKIEMIEVPRNYKPGFPLELKFKVSTQDDIPISDENPRAIKIEHGYACDAQDGTVYFPIPSNGIVNVTFQTPTNELISSNLILVTYKEYTHNAYSPSKLTTPSKIYMDLQLDTKTPELNSQLGAKVKMNVPFRSFNYVLTGRGRVLITGRIELPEGTSKESHFEIPVPRDAAPEARLLVYTVVPETGEVVAENVKFNLNSVFDNNLTINVSKEVGEPGETVKISLETKDDSVIALRGVDQSVLLLKEDRDITVKTVEDEVKAVQAQLDRNRQWGGSQSFQAFDETGVIVMTNGKLEFPYRYYPIVNDFSSAYAGGVAPAMAFESAADRVVTSTVPTRVQSLQSVKLSASNKRPAPPPGPEIRIRKEFPETWLWEEVQANSSVSVLDKVIPDTITSWYISGFSLSPTTGIGVAKSPAILRTFRPFFLSLNIPYSVVKGEIFGLQVLVHNYQETDIEAQITLQNTGNGLEFLEQPDTKTAPSVTKSVKVGKNQVTSVTFVVRPLKFGYQSLDIKGVTVPNGSGAQAGDGISKPLLVKPPGQKQILNKAFLVDLRSKSSSKETLTVELPPNRVEGADSVKFSIISDLLGTTVSNLDKLLRMPTGCGEQNMVYFAPIPVILQYLKIAGTLTPQVKSKAVRFLESGYQRELSYRHDDGSFSAFGKYDRYGSTWLTAFVVRSFVTAKPYVTIDDAVLTDAIRFLASKQQVDGSFVEHGFVHSHELKGGAVESLSLSAYVTLALVESTKVIDVSQESLANVTNVRDRGIDFLAKSTGLAADDPYAAAILTYTLQTASNSKAATVKQVLEKLAKRDGDLKYWEPKPIEIPVGNDTLPVKRPWTPRVKPVSVEMTSYALLIYLAEGNLEEALAVGRWVIQQRSPEGGFISTQDTVVGLTALARFAMATTAGHAPDLKVKITYEGGSKEFVVNKENQIVFQEAILPTTVRSVEVSSEGKGSALAQFTTSYYVEEKAEGPAFTLNISKEEGPAILNLGVCAAYTHQKNKVSNMAVLEVNLPSGYTFDSDDLQSLRSIENLKRFDLEEGDSQVNIYFDSLSSVNSCVNLRANRVFKVVNPAKAYVQVYDYYDTTLRAREFYEPPTGLTTCDICVGDNTCSIKNCV